MSEGQLWKFEPYFGKCKIWTPFGCWFSVFSRSSDPKWLSPQIEDGEFARLQLASLLSEFFHDIWWIFLVQICCLNMILRAAPLHGMVGLGFSGSFADFHSHSGFHCLLRGWTPSAERRMPRFDQQDLPASQPAALLGPRIRPIRRRNPSHSRPAPPSECPWSPGSPPNSLQRREQSIPEKTPSPLCSKILPASK